MHGIVKRRAVTGVTLFEVMIALVIMSIGLLGLASLQLNSMRNSHSSEKRTQAAIIANDLIERMRANPVAVNGDTTASIASGQYAAALPTTPTIDCTSPPANICQDTASAAATCDATQMATYDAFTVWCNAKSLLPSSTISVSCSDATGVTLACAAASYRTITVGWLNQVEGSTTGKTKSLSMTFRP